MVSLTSRLRISSPELRKGSRGLMSYLFGKTLLHGFGKRIWQSLSDLSESNALGKDGSKTSFFLIIINMRK